MDTAAAVNDHRDAEAAMNRHLHAMPAPRRSGQLSRVVAAAAVALSALAIATAAPASAHGPHHHVGNTGHHAPAATVSAQHSGVAASTSSPTKSAAASAIGASPSGGPAAGAAHDKCKRAKNGQLPPWCSDPAAGWGSTLHRAEGSFPTMSAARSTSDAGRAFAGQGARH